MMANRIKHKACFTRKQKPNFLVKSRLKLDIEKRKARKKARALKRAEST